jgi:hypothetical protein
MNMGHRNDEKEEYENGYESRRRRYNRGDRKKRRKRDERSIKMEDEGKGKTEREK